MATANSNPIIGQPAAGHQLVPLPALVYDQRGVFDIGNLTTAQQSSVLYNLQTNPPIRGPGIPEKAYKSSGRINTLRGLPPQKDVALNNPGRAPSPLQQHEWEASLAFIVGNIAAQPCWHCQQGYGIFSQCVTVAGMKGCANCFATKHGHHCSHHVGAPPAGFTHMTRNGWKA